MSGRNHLRLGESARGVGNVDLKLVGSASRAAIFFNGEASEEGYACDLQTAFSPRYPSHRN